MVDTNVKLNFNDYIGSIKNISSDLLYKNIELLPNIIIYGPSGTGKYSCALNIIKQFSKSELKYYKKIYISNSKSEYYLKISDIHFEIDMEILGCNSKILWNDIYNNIIDIITNNNSSTGIILCKNFHTVNSELLEIFYSYMQKEIFCNYTIKFIICSESISFIPSSILTTTKRISSEKYNKTYYKKNFGASDVNINLLNNLKCLSITNTNTYENNNINELTLLMNPHISICDSIVDIILQSQQDINFSNLRQILYDILVYNLNIHECIFYILKRLINDKKILNNKDINESILENTFIFFKYFNNNYRPIYHLENYILYLIKTVHEL